MVADPVPLCPDQPANPLIERNCPCPRDCPRHGNCFACVANHRDTVTSTPPACLRRGAEKSGKAGSPEESGDHL